MLVISVGAGGDEVMLVRWTSTTLMIDVPFSVVMLLTGSKVAIELPKVVDAGLGVAV
jgi:hypothetical protein